MMICGSFKNSFIFELYLQPVQGVTLTHAEHACNWAGQGYSLEDCHKWWEGGAKPESVGEKKNGQLEASARPGAGRAKRVVLV